MCAGKIFVSSKTDLRQPLLSVFGEEEDVPVIMIGGHWSSLCHHDAGYVLNKQLNTW